MRIVHTYWFFLAFIILLFSVCEICRNRSKRAHIKTIIMLNFFKTKTFKVGSLVVAFALALALTASAMTFSGPTLRVGSKGGEVAQLQTLVGATADGSFGPMTKAAVMAWQASNGLTADGVFGPKSMAVANGGSSMSGGSGALCPNGMTLASNCTTAPGSSSETLCPNGMTLASNCMTAPTGGSTGVLTGGAGSLVTTTPTVLSQYNNEDVGEGQKDVVVAGWEIEADDSSDLSLTVARVTLTGTSNTGSKTASKYFTEVSVMLDGTEVATADIDDFSKSSSGVYSKSINLSNAIVKAGSKAKITIAISAASAIDSTDLSGDAWTVDLDSLRYMDGTGAILNDTLAIAAVSMDFKSFSSASGTSLKISTASDNPKAGLVEVSSTGSTNDVVLLSGKLKLEGDSDVMLESFPVTFGAVTSNMNVIAENVTLKLGSQEFSETVSSIAAGATASITFDDLDFDIEAGETVNFQVLVDVADIDDFTAGASLTASVTATNRAAMEVENEEGDQLTAGERSGTAGGESQEFRENGIKIELVSTDAVKSANDTDNLDTGTFTIKFKITAFGDDIYVASVASPDGAGANAYTLDYNGTATTTDQSAVLVNDTDSDLTSGGTYLIQEGESEVFTMTVLRNGSATDGLYRVSLTNIKWDTDDDSTPDQTYSTNLDSFKTKYIDLD